MAKEKKEKEKKPAPPKTEKKSKKKSQINENPILKLEKPLKIELQNFLFGTSEKKLMVSDDFLNEMTVKYISKRMRTINTAFANIHLTRSAVNFFKNTKEIEKLIEDLIVVEKYYPFKNPVPSIYKRNYLAHKPAAITSMIIRIWKTALSKYPLDEDVPIDEINPKIIEYYDSILDEILSQRSNLSEQDIQLINSYYVRIHGEQSAEETPKDESTEEAATTDDNEEAPADNTIEDEQVQS